MVNTSNFVVLKFGGTSVATFSRWQTITKIVQRRIEEGLKPLLVCSALTTVSDKLETLIAQTSEGKQGELIVKIRAQHDTLAKELGVDPSILDDLFGELEQLAFGASLVGETSPRVYARIMAFGELLSTRLGVAFLQKKGFKATWLDARDILTSRREINATESRHFLSATCTDDVSPTLAQKIGKLDADVLITQGFIAGDDNGATVLLGRGGSDTSAAYIATKLSAQRCEIWTDVSGIYSANPREIPNARLLLHLDYDEAQEIASCGAKVLHPHCICPCQKHGIPMAIHCINHPDVDYGTTISHQTTNHDAEVKAIGKKTGIMLISLETMGMWQQVGYLSKVFNVFKNHGVSVDLVSTSQSNLTVSLDTFQAGPDTRTIDRLMEDMESIGKVKCIESCASISLVGKGIRTILHRLGSVLNVFEEKKVHLVSQAANDLNLTFVVDEEVADRLVVKLHNLLFDDSTLGPTFEDIFGSNGSQKSKVAPWWQRQRKELLDLGAKQTPVFVYDEKSLKVQSDQMKAVSSADRIFYAIKANSHPGILTCFYENGLGFECVSLAEINHIISIFGTTIKDRILFTPNFAPKAEYQEALRLGIHVTIDNLFILEKWGALFKGHSILVRLDPGRGRGHHVHVRTAGNQSKFGILPLDLPKLHELVQKNDIHIKGFHAHIGSGIRNPEVWGETAHFLVKAAQEFDSVTVLNVGGGYGIVEKPGQTPLDLNEVNASLARVKKAYPGYEIWLEPGRFLVAEAGILLTRVTQVKHKGEVCYIGVDVGMNSLVRPALYGAFHEIINLTRFAEPRDQLAHIVGPICESGDTLGHARKIAKAEEGDILLIATTGAYGRVMSSHYNMREPALETILPV